MGYIFVYCYYRSKPIVLYGKLMSQLIQKRESCPALSFLLNGPVIQKLPIKVNITSIVVL
jgi:hypothetical protein